MHLLKQRSTVFYVGFVLILTMAIGGVAFGAFATGCTTSATESCTSASASIIAGTLSETSPTGATVNDASNNPSVTLNGTDQTANYSFDINVIDARGSGAGWNLTMQTGQFSDGTHQLATSASKLFSISGACVTGTTCNSAHGGTSQNLSMDLSSGLKIWTSNNTGEGMGSFTITPTVHVAVPANTYAGTYISTVTVDLIAGP